jgi:hypothetical protein
MAGAVTRPPFCRKPLAKGASRWLVKERRGLHQCRAAWKPVTNKDSRWRQITKNQKDKTANAVFAVMDAAPVRRANARRPYGAAVSALRVAVFSF